VLSPCWLERLRSCPRAIAIFVGYLLLAVVVVRAWEGRLPDEVSGRGLKYTTQELKEETREALDALTEHAGSRSRSYKRCARSWTMRRPPVCDWSSGWMICWRGRDAALKLKRTRRMPKPNSHQRELTQIVKDLWDAMLAEPADLEDRRVDVRRAHEGGRRAADRYLEELVAALDLGREPKDVASFPYFSLSHDADTGWTAVLSRFVRSGDAARAALEARAAEVSSALAAQADRVADPEPPVLDENGAAEEARRQAHDSRAARAAAALERAQEAIGRIDRIRV
jgi:hypothetical protein